MPEAVPIEILREELLRSEQTIRVNDLGAGSKMFDLPIRRVSTLQSAIAEVDARDRPLQPPVGDCPLPH